MKRPASCVCGSHHFEPFAGGVMCVDCWREFSVPPGVVLTRLPVASPVVQLLGPTDDAPDLSRALKRRETVGQSTFLGLLAS